MSVSASAQERIDFVRSGGSPSEHALLATSFAEITDPEKIREQLNSIYGLPANYSRTCARAALLGNWLKIDPDAALTWCRVREDRLLGPLCESLAAQDLELAKSWAMRAGEDELTGQLSIAVVGQLADSDPAGALEFIANFESRVRGVQMSAALKKLAQSDPRWLLREVEGMRPGIRSRARAEAAAALAAQSPAEALEWWRSQTDAPKLAVGLLKEIRSEHWEDALKLLSEMDSPDDNHVSTWAWGEPAAFLELATSDRWSDAHLDGVKNAVRSWSRSDPKSLQKWVAEHPEQTDITELVEQIFLQEEAQANFTFPPRTAAEMFADRKFSSRDYGGLPPEERAAIPDQLAGLPSAEAGKVVSALASNNIMTIPLDDWGKILAAASLDDKEARSQVIEITKRVAGLAARRVPEEAFQWALGLPDGAVRDEAIRLAIDHWESYEPGAPEAATKMPDAPE